MLAKLSSPRVILISLAVLLALGAGVWAILPSDPHARVGLVPAPPNKNSMPIVTPAPQFSFPDQDNENISTQSLKGKVWIADFIFTHCGNTCPRMTAQRVELQKKITDPRVMFLSISVDPERDDRATRKTYAAEKKIDETRWKFVSPPDHETALKIAQAMRVAARPAPPRNQDPILHSDRFVLIDANAQIRGTYPLDDPASMDRLVSDAQSFAQAATR
jgi:cytochrome oxidase Cu insertion factor (SCO1/SenC/PrrC family)